MESISFIFDRLNQPPFNKNYASMSEFDSKSSLQMMDILCEIVGKINPELSFIMGEASDIRIENIVRFLAMMRFNMQDEEQFRKLLSSGDKETITIVMHDCLKQFERYTKRAYLGKFCMPIEIPPEFLGEDLILDLQQRLKEMQSEFIEVHKEVESIRKESGGTRPQDLKSEIAQLEAERSQLQAKIQRLNKEKDSLGDDSYFQEMLQLTSVLRREQEEEAKLMNRMRENRANLQTSEVRYNDAAKRLNETKSSGVGNQSAEELLSKLQRDVQEMNGRRESIEHTLGERESYLEKINGWENTDRVLTSDDVREKRIQVDELQSNVNQLMERLDSAAEKNSKLMVFRQASANTLKKLREKEDEIDRLSHEKQRLTRQVEEKDAQALQKGGSKIGRMDLNRYKAVVREKIEKYRKMREELSALRAELVVLQRTEQILKSRHKNLDDFLEELERRKGVEGYRDTQRALVEMTEKTAEVDQMKGATLEQISDMVESISREFRSKQTALQPLMVKLKGVRQEYMEVEADYQEKKGNFDKVAVGLEMEKSTLERECDTHQVCSLLLLSLLLYLYDVCMRLVGLLLLPEENFL